MTKAGDASQVPAATLASCNWIYWNNFSTDNWSLGSAGGTYTPTLWAYRYCWFTEGNQNNFYVNWAAYSWPSWNQGTYDSNWANANGYGYWGADWVNGHVQTSPGSWNGFWCRGELYADTTSYWYPGCGY